MAQQHTINDPTPKIPPSAEPTTKSEADAKHGTQVQSADEITAHTNVTKLPKIPGFEIIGEIGRGGMGIVYRARDTSMNREVALKFLQDKYDANSPAAKRFIEEAQITGQLQHPGIPAVH